MKVSRGSDAGESMPGAAPVPESRAMTEAERLARIQLLAAAAKRGARDAAALVDRQRAMHFASPAGFGALFPGFGTRGQVQAQAKPKRERMVLSGLSMPDLPSTKPGERITIAGLRADPSKPGGWDMQCEPGHETVLEVLPNGDLIEDELP